MTAARILVAIVVMVAATRSARADDTSPPIPPPIPPPILPPTVPAPAPAANPPPADNTELLASYSRTARDAARAGHCDVVVQIGQKVKTLDAAYFAQMFVADAAIAACIAGMPPRPIIPPRLTVVVSDDGPTPSVARIAGEVFVGGLTGIGGAFVGVIAGLAGCAGSASESECIGPVAVGAYMGGVLSVPLGVYTIGKSGGQTGSLGWTYVGSLLGGLAGLAIYKMVPEDGGIIGIFLGPPVGAVIGFNATLRYERRMYVTAGVGSLIRYDGRGLSVGVPLVTRASSVERTVTSVPLVSGSF